MGDFTFLTESSKPEFHQNVVHRLKRCLEVLWQSNCQVMSKILSKSKHLVGLIDYLLHVRSSKVDSTGFLFIHLPLHSQCLPGGWQGAKPGSFKIVFCHISVHNSLANFSTKKGLSISKSVNFYQKLPYFPVLWVTFSKNQFETATLLHTLKFLLTPHQSSPDSGFLLKRAERELRFRHEPERFPVSDGSSAIGLGLEPSFSCHQSNFVQETSVAFCRPL